MKRLAFCFILAGLLNGCESAEPITSLPVGEFAPDPDTVTIVINNYNAQTGNKFQNLFVSNDSVIAAQGSLHLSTARDGFYDTLKQSLNPIYGFSVTVPETLQNFADLMLYYDGINLGQQNQLACGQTLSTTNDAIIYNDDRLGGNPPEFLGLRDCDKVYMGMNPNSFDYNQDGIPDYVEMKCGMSPINKNIALTSTAGDGVSDIDKCKKHIPIDENAFTQPNQVFAYQYSIQVNSDGSQNFTTSNIPILNSGEENLITFTITETDAKSGLPVQIFTAFAVLPAGSTGKTLSFNYWGTPGNFWNQKVSPQ